MGLIEGTEKCSLTESLEIGCLIRLEFLPKSDQRTFLSDRGICEPQAGMEQVGTESFTEAVMPVAHSTLYFTHWDRTKLKISLKGL